MTNVAKPLIATGLILLSFSSFCLARADDSFKTTRVVDGGLPSYAPDAEVSGRLSIAGSDTMRPLLARMAADFRGAQPAAAIGVEGGGTEDAVREFIIGYSQQRRGEKSRLGHNGAATATVVAAARDLTPQEIKAFVGRFGYEPLAFPVALDAVAIYVNGANPVQGLTLAQVDAIFGAERRHGQPEDIVTWDQAGLKEWERRPIHLYGRDEKSGTRRFFQRIALLNGAFKEAIEEPRGPASEILRIAGDSFAIGYAAIGFQGEAVRIVPLAEKAGGPYITPTLETLRDGTYPLRRHLYLYVNHNPRTKMSPLLREFLTFINSRQGQEALAKNRFHPIPVSIAIENLAALAGSADVASAKQEAGILR